MNPKTDPLAKTLFILGDFPQPAQTFIQREMVEMKKRGATVNVMADTRVESSHLHPLLQEIEQCALFADTPWKWISRSLLKGVVRAPRFARDLKWALSLPHRTRYNRARFVISLRTAMDLAPRIMEQGITYLHAHFAAYQTETAMCLSRLTGIPYGATWHAYGIWQDANLLKEKIAGALTILTCTEYNAFHLRELAGADADKIHLVRHGLDLSAIPVFPPETEPETPTLVAIGRLTPKKGFNHLIEAAALLRDRAFASNISNRNLPNMPAYDPQTVGATGKGARLSSRIWRFYRSRLPSRSYPPMNPDTRVFLEKLFQNRNAGLSELIGRDVADRWAYMKK